MDPSFGGSLVLADHDRRNDAGMSRSIPRADRHGVALQPPAEHIGGDVGGKLALGLVAEHVGGIQLVSAARQ